MVNTVKTQKFQHKFKMADYDSRGFPTSIEGFLRECNLLKTDQLRYVLTYRPTYICGDRLPNSDTNTTLASGGGAWSVPEF